MAKASQVRTAASHYYATQHKKDKDATIAEAAYGGAVTRKAASVVVTAALSEFLKTATKKVYKGIKTAASHIADAAAATADTAVTAAEVVE